MDVDPAEDVPPTSAWVADGMAVLQSLKDILSIFPEKVEVMFDAVTTPVSLKRRIDFVTDQYPDISIKDTS